MARIYIRAEVEVHIDVPEEGIEGWDGEDESCPPEVREAMQDALTIIPQRAVIDIGWPGEEWVEVHAEVLDVIEVRAES